MKNIKIIVIVLSILWSCTDKNGGVDAYGNFEAIEIMVSSEANGKIMVLQTNEGDILEQNTIIGYIDTIQLHLKKEQLLAAIQALHAKTQNVKVQIEVLQRQKTNLLRERQRVEALLLDSAATMKQFDDINGEIEVVDQRIAATRSQLNSANNGILSEIKPLQVQIMQIKDQIDKSIIRNPIRGTVLTKYAEESEITSFGKPLYKIADLEKIILRAYISENQLSQITLGQDVTVKIDAPDNKYKSFNGTITWISSSAEFTPKVIQTREERVNMVYALKIDVPNDGSMKIGMPGEVLFTSGE